MQQDGTGIILSSSHHSSSFSILKLNLFNQRIIILHFCVLIFTFYILESLQSYNIRLKYFYVRDYTYTKKGEIYREERERGKKKQRQSSKNRNRR